MQALYDARDARVAENAVRINSLRLRSIAGDLDALTKTAPVEKQRKKVIRKLLVLYVETCFVLYAETFFVLCRKL